MPRYKEEDRSASRLSTRNRLLEAATQEFAQLGFAKANIDTISKAAGFAKGTIYNYFPSKRALMMALIEHIAEHHLSFVATRVTKESKCDDRLHQFFLAGFAFVEEFLSEGLVMVNNLYGPDQEFKQEMYAAYQPMFSLVADEIIAYGIEQGQFRPVEAFPMAGLLMTIYLGSASQLNEQGKPWLPASFVSEFTLHALKN